MLLILLLLQVDPLRMVAEWIGLVFQWTSPFVVPFGIFMRWWIDAAMNFFPADNLTFYIIIFIVILVAGFIVNIKWTGEKEIVYKREEGIETGISKCKSCGKPLGDSEFCPYCGSRN